MEKMEFRFTLPGERLQGKKPFVALSAQVIWKSLLKKTPLLRQFLRFRPQLIIISQFGRWLLAIL